MSSLTSSPLGTNTSYLMEESPSSDVQMDGYLRKRTSKKSGILHVRSWKKRWFILAGGMLMYAPGPHQASRRIREAFHVADIRAVRLGTGMLEFEVEMRSRTLELRAKSSNEMKRWMSAIRAAREAAITARMKLVENHSRDVESIMSPMRKHSSLVLQEEEEEKESPFEGKTLRCPSSDLSHLVPVDWEDKCQVSSSGSLGPGLGGDSLSWAKERPIEDDMAALGGLGQKNPGGGRRASVPWHVRDNKCAGGDEEEGPDNTGSGEREAMGQGRREMKATFVSTEVGMEGETEDPPTSTVVPAPKPRAVGGLSTRAKSGPLLQCPDMPSGSSTNPLHDQGATSTESTPPQQQGPGPTQRDRRRQSSSLRWQSFTDKFAAMGSSLEDFADFGRKEDTESSLYKISLGRRNVSGCHNSTFRMPEPAPSQPRSSEGVGRFRVGGWGSVDSAVGFGPGSGAGVGVNVSPWCLNKSRPGAGKIAEEDTWKVEDIENNSDTSLDKDTPHSMGKRLPLYASQNFNVGRVSDHGGHRASWGGGEFGENVGSPHKWKGVENVHKERSGVVGGVGVRGRGGVISLVALGEKSQGTTSGSNSQGMGVKALSLRG